MRIFISWSKEPSRTVAEALRDWLPDVIQNLQPWVSSADIEAGTRWGTKIAAALASTKIGIICVTPDNQREPWLLFEAGALAKTLDDTFVCPYLIQMASSDLIQGPLTQFQAKLADENGTLELLSTINAAQGSDALPPDRLRRLFDRSWPYLGEKLKALPRAATRVRRPQEELLTEVLDTVRSIARRLPMTRRGGSWRDLFSGGGAYFNEGGLEQAAHPALRRRVRDQDARTALETVLRKLVPSPWVPEIVSKVRDLPDDELRLVLSILKSADPYRVKEVLERYLAGPPAPTAQTSAAEGSGDELIDGSSDELTKP
jgi:TIR domain